MKTEIQKKINKIKKAIEVCDNAGNCEDCPFHDVNLCDNEFHNLVLEVIEELVNGNITVTADINSDLHKEYCDTIANLVADRRKRLEKRSKRVLDDINVSRQYLNAISKIPQKEWSMLDTWRVGYQEGKSAANKEWLEWLEDNFNE